MRIPGLLQGLSLLGVLTLSFGTSAHYAPPHSQEETARSLPSGISVSLSDAWAPLKSDLDSPPQLLAESAPPVHFTEVALLENAKENSLLLLATSNNPLVGHDAYWLDSEMHSPKSSPLSLPNVLFYLFFPPPYTCLNGVEDSYAGAGRASMEDDEPPDLEVYLACQYSPTLPDFYAAQITTGIILRKKEDKLQTIGVLKDFYLAPMEVMDFSGFTFYVFEAKATNPVTAGTVSFFNLPGSLEGTQADFFWAIGAQTPFPFARDRARADTPIIHLAYAGLGSNERTEFIRLLHTVRAK
jgi:hypothetical protein